MSQASPYLPVFLSTSSKKPAMTKEESDRDLQMLSESNSFTCLISAEKGRKEKERERREGGNVFQVRNKDRKHSVLVSKWYCWNPQLCGPRGCKELDGT